MNRRSILALCAGAMLAGVGVGTTLDSWRLAADAQADARQVARVETLYREISDTPNPLVEGGQIVAKVARVTTPSVVHIQSQHKDDEGSTVEETGSGVLMNLSAADGTFVVTNRHVVAGGKLNAVSIHLHDGRVIGAERLWADPATDIAVLKVNAPNLQVARWGDSDDLEIGHMVLAMGSPFGLSQSVTLGIISAKGRRSLKLGADRGVLNQDFLQTDAAINPGNSGGPLIDLHGRVVAINTAIASNSGGNDGIGFSIPSNLVRRVVEQLVERGRVQRAYLGIKLDSRFDLATARRLSLDRVRGARIVEVYANTPASEARLLYDDVVLAFGNIPVQDENHLINLVSLTPVGSRMDFHILRDGKRKTINVLLADRDDLERRARPNANTRGK